MLRNRTWAIIGPRCLMTCELVQSQLPRVSPIGTQLGYMIHYWVFRDLHFFFSALQFSAPEHVNGLRKRTSFFFCDGPTCGQTVDKRERHQKVVDTGVKYPKPEFLVLCAQHFHHKFLNKMHKIFCWVIVGSCSKLRKYVYIITLRLFNSHGKCFIYSWFTY